MPTAKADKPATAAGPDIKAAKAVLKQAATATFFLLLVISFIDVLGGFAVSLRSAQRGLTVEGTIPHIS